MLITIVLILYVCYRSMMIVLKSYHDCITLSIIYPAACGAAGPD